MFVICKTKMPQYYNFSPNSFFASYCSYSCDMKTLQSCHSNYSYDLKTYLNETNYLSYVFRCYCIVNIIFLMLWIVQGHYFLTH